jgi:hypothetical protein
MNYQILSRRAFLLVFWALWFTPAGAAAMTVGKPAPDIAGEPWINSKPLTINVLKGRVVMVEFWTYG